VAPRRPQIEDERLLARLRARESGRICRKSSCFGRASSPRKNIADSAGDNVNALNAEIAIENAIVSENCR